MEVVTANDKLHSKLTPVYMFDIVGRVSFTNYQ